MSVSFNVVPQLSDDAVISDSAFWEMACFAPWMIGAAPFDLEFHTSQAGWFVILADGFAATITPAHQAVLIEAVEWLAGHGFQARLLTTKRCRHRERTGTRAVVDGSPVLAVGFTATDYRARLYHGLCFARLFTREFLEDRAIRTCARLVDLFTAIFRQRVLYTSHLPFRDRMVAQDWQTGHLTPPIDERLGAAYFAYLNQEYLQQPWQQYSERRVFDTTTGWTGGLTYDAWLRFYEQYITQEPAP